MYCKRSIDLFFGGERDRNAKGGLDVMQHREERSELQTLTEMQVGVDFVG